MANIDLQRKYHSLSKIIGWMHKYVVVRLWRRVFVLVVESTLYGRNGGVVLCRCSTRTSSNVNTKGFTVPGRWVERNCRIGREEFLKSWMFLLLVLLHLEQGLKMHTKPWVRARARRGYWENMQPASKIDTDPPFITVVIMITIMITISTSICQAAGPTARPCPARTTGE